MPKRILHIVPVVAVVAALLVAGAALTPTSSADTVQTGPRPTAKPAAPAPAGHSDQHLVAANHRTGMLRFYVEVVRQHDAERFIDAVQAEQAEQARRAAAAQAEADRRAAARRSTAAPAPTRPNAAPTQGSGRCGGNLPPCYVMGRESGGDTTVWNGGCHGGPCGGGASSASGKWQIVSGTWGGYGGYPNAASAPESVQDAKAAEVWAGGAGCSHWSAC